MQSKKILIGIIGCAFFMENLDGTIINTALPQIAASIGTDPLHLKIALTAYLLAAGIIIPVSGWLADRFGCQRIFAGALLIFLLGSIACGVSQNLTELVLARIVQGTGGALSLPVGRLIFVRNFKKSELASVMSLTATFGLLGPSFGPVIGGALTTYFNWRAIFFVNIPIGLLGFYLARKHIKNYKDPKLRKFDTRGFVILSISLTALLIGLDTIINPIINEFVTIFLFLAGVSGLIVYVYYARYKEYALISMQLFKMRIFNLAILGSLFVRLTINAVPFLVPLLLQIGFGYSPMVAGLFIAVSALGMLMVKFVINRLIQQIGHRRILVINAFMLAASTLMLVLLSLHPPVVVIGGILLLNGIFASVQFTAMNTLAYGNINTDFQASGSSFISSFQQIMSSFSIAIAALILQLFLHSHTILHTDSPPAFAKTFLVLAIFPLLGVFIFKRLPKNLN